MKRVALGCGVALFTLVLAVWSIFPTDRVVVSWKQPSALATQYAYEASLIERDVDIFTLPFERRLKLQIHVTGNHGYGHSVPVDLFGVSNHDSCAKSCRVEWTAAGVEFVQASGHRIFVAATAYEGGR
jgi:hypothetical protein